MASKTLGRVTCPVGCSHTAAQVKIKTDKGEKTAYPYVHCAGCGVQLHTRSEEQARHLLAMTRPEKGAADVPAAPPAPEPAPDVPAPNKQPETPPAPVKRAGLFDGLFSSPGAPA
jgi:hypothetical protein